MRRRYLVAGLVVAVIAGTVLVTVAIQYENQLYSCSHPTGVGQGGTEPGVGPICPPPIEDGWFYSSTGLVLGSTLIRFAFTRTPKSLSRPPGQIDARADPMVKTGRSGTIVRIPTTNVEPKSRFV
jgi:hypothetical protein